MNSDQNKTRENPNREKSRTRIIFHVDVNSAFLSWSALKRLREEPGSVDLRTIPSAVSGDVKTRHGVITARSIPAKKYGVKTGEPVFTALKKCPQLVLVPSDFENYRACSHALMELLLKYTSLLQQISIDEAWLDVTDLVSGKKVFRDAPRFSRKGASNARTAAADPRTFARLAEGKTARTAAADPGSSTWSAGRKTARTAAADSGASVRMTEGKTSRDAVDPGAAGNGQDLLTVRQNAVRLADQLRETVRKRLGFTVNVGVSTNKFLAKMASDFEKPDRTHTLYPDEIPEKLWPLPMEDMYGCGRATAQRLHTIGIHTIGMAAAADEKALQSVLGEKAGRYIFERANGIASDQVNPKREEAKSISNELTLTQDVTAENYDRKGIPVIQKLSGKVASRMKKAGMLGQTVTFQVKTSDFKRYSRQTALDDPTDDAARIEEAALTLANRLLKGADGLFLSGVSIRLIGVGVSKLSGRENRQLDLFTWAEKNQEQKGREEAEQKQKKLDEMLSAVNRKFGEGKLAKGIRTEKTAGSSDSE